ncbi:MAG: M81 family metallopeptidase [Gemmataceae bacterium]
MRIAVAGFMHESNTFNPLLTDKAAFLAQGWHQGPQLTANWRDAYHEVGGFLEGLAHEKVDAIPLLMAWGTPSGPVTQAVFEEVSRDIIAGLKREKPDGLLLALHGAMVATHEDDADGAFVALLRQAMGPDFPIVITLDLHGNISQRLVDNVTAAIAYRTNPHIDQRARGAQAAQLITRIVRGEVRPRLALAKPPMIVNIMAHDTSREPLLGIMAEARGIEQRPGVLAVSVLPGFAYSDVPQMGPAVIVVTDNDAALAKREADRLGELIWSKREEMNRPLPDAKEAVRQALAAAQRPVVLVDTGDNVGGGSAADGTVILEELLAQGATDSVVCLYAPEEVQTCQVVGVGQMVDLTLGGKVDRLHGAPVTVTGKVRLLHDGDYMEPLPRHGGKRFHAMGLTAVVEVHERNFLVLTTQRHPPFSLRQVTCLGLEPRDMRILVVKAAIAYRAAYLPIAGTIIEVDTPGITAVNPHRLEYRKVRRPLYPLNAGA